jgi:hypothetical protein
LTGRTSSSPEDKKDPAIFLPDIDPEDGAVEGISASQVELFRRAMEEARSQIEKIDGEMQAEIARAREKLMRLQATKKRYLSIFQDAARILGIPSKEE